MWVHRSRGMRRGAADGVPLRSPGSSIDYWRVSGRELARPVAGGMPPSVIWGYRIANLCLNGLNLFWCAVLRATQQVPDLIGVRTSLRPPVWWRLVWLFLQRSIFLVGYFCSGSESALGSPLGLSFSICYDATHSRTAPTYLAAWMSEPLAHLYRSHIYVFLRRGVVSCTSIFSSDVCAFS